MLISEITYTAIGRIRIVVVNRTVAWGIADRSVVCLVAGYPRPTFVVASSVTATASWPSTVSFGLHLVGVELLGPLGRSFAGRAQPRGKQHHTTYHSHHSFERPIPWAKGFPSKPSWPTFRAFACALSFAFSTIGSDFGF